ncbi:MAG: hypothetical protein D4R97_09085 [Bacteroidetes bacterium]|nr:MAG: hypothetical protein D4R97_09085 [Bacteroidota bacterium]
MRILLHSALLIPFMLLSPVKVNAQGTYDLKKAELRLREVFTGINRGETDSLRLALSLDFQKQLRMALTIPGSARYPWDSLKYVAKIESSDGVFRLYNWNVPKINGGNRYFCLVQFEGKLKDRPSVALSDWSDSIADPVHFRADSLHWYGSLYYKVIPFKLRNKKNSYVLLGWNGISSEISGKLIEVLTLGDDGTPQFGAAVFPDYNDGKSVRIIFRFSSSAGMNLRYQMQVIPGNPVWNKKKRVYESSDHSYHMIVFDHLMPMYPQLEGQYKFYVPASETAEGFVYMNYAWKYIKEFDARNP